jgi:hypothetical protein
MPKEKKGMKNSFFWTFSWFFFDFFTVGAKTIYKKGMRRDSTTNQHEEFNHGGTRRKKLLF